MLNQSKALGATYQPSLPAGSREGSLNRDEFFILLASLQAKLRMGDDLFQRRFAGHQEPDARRGSSSTTYSYAIGLDEQRSFEDGLVNTAGSRVYLFCLPIKAVAEPSAAPSGAKWIASRGGRGGD